MIVDDVVEIAKASSLFNLTVSKNDAVLIKFVNLGVSELYRRFNILIKAETIITNPHLALYELRNKDVSLLLTVYNSRQEELNTTDVLNGDFDFKIMNYKSFLLNKPREDLLFAIYKASAPRLTSLEDEIEAPDAMMDALLTYVAYMGHSTINKDNINEASAYAQRFEQACRDLDDQGYRVPINSESISVLLKGFV